MKKIKRSFLFALSGIVVQLLSLIYFTAPVYAAPAVCYAGSGEEFRRLGSCPTSNGFRDTAGGVTSPAIDRCYQEEFIPGPNISVYVEGDCSSLSTLATQVEQNLCTNSDGEWQPGSGPRPPACRCPDTKPMNSSTRQCTTPTADDSADEGASQTDPGRIASRPNDCDQDNLDGSNCGIIAYLNIFMNMVSGAIAIAVIGNIIYAGIQYSMAQGDPGNVGKAKTRIRNALIAFIMYVSLFGFLQWLIPGGVF